MFRAGAITPRASAALQGSGGSAALGLLVGLLDESFALAHSHVWVASILERLVGVLRHQGGHSHVIAWRKGLCTLCNGGLPGGGALALCLHHEASNHARTEVRPLSRGLCTIAAAAASDEQCANQSDEP